jgi:hypothetical protein
MQPRIIADLDDNEWFYEQHGFDRLQVKRGTYSDTTENFIL